MYKTSFRDYASHIATRILVPYLWLQLISLGLKFLLFGGRIRVPRYLLGLITGNSFIVSGPSNPLYFVLLLFISQMVIFLFVKLSKGSKGVVFALVFGLTVIPMMTGGKPVVWHLNVAPTAMLFMLIGRFLMDCYISSRKVLRRLKLPVYIAVCVAVLIVGGVLGVYNGRASIHGNIFGDQYMIFVISAVLTSVAFALLVMLMPSVGIFNFIGKNTIFLLGVHEVMLTCVGRFFPEVCEKGWFIAIASVVCYFLPVPIAWVLNKAAPYICAMAPKENNLLVKICKFISVAAVLIIPYLYFTMRAFDGALRKGGIMTIVAVVIFVVLVVAIERLFSLLMPFFFLQNKKERRIEEVRKPTVYEDDDIIIVLPVEEV